VAKVKLAAEAAEAAGVMVPYDAQQVVNAAGAADVPPEAPARQRNRAASCVARRAVSIRIPATFRRRRVLRARITTAGHRAIITHGGRRVRLVLRWHTGDKVRVRIALRLHGGKRVVQVRAYRLCRR
jgi:hypothetical protein